MSQSVQSRPQAAISRISPSMDLHFDLLGKRLRRCLVAEQRLHISRQYPVNQIRMSISQVHGRHRKSIMGAIRRLVVDTLRPHT
jgi:hypothetical protein